MKIRLILYVMAVSSLAIGQIRTTEIQEIILPGDQIWSNPRFSPSGGELFLTNSEYNGIWEYSFVNKLVKEITVDAGSGYGFTVSENGEMIAYRRTVQQGDHITRRQESVELSLQKNEKRIIEQGNSVSIPVFSRNTPVNAKSLNMTAAENYPVLMGIEDTKIILAVNGKKVTLDPLDGQYIWPVLSPDKKMIVAVEMDRGAFTCSIDGSDIKRLGKCNAPVWTKDGKWIVGMDDKDDGHSIFASDIIAVSPEGMKRYNLTETFPAIALYPSVSPFENKIVFSTSEGKVYILTYEEVQ